MVKVSYLFSNTAAGECARYIQSNHMPRCAPSIRYSLSLSLSVSPCCACCPFPLHTYVHTCTRTHNHRSKFFQGISRLINRLVVWGSSEVQRSRLNPLTGRIISGRWVHTSPVAPHKPLPSQLDLWQNKPPPVQATNAFDSKHC